jgi:hypothetical protein
MTMQQVMPMNDLYSQSNLDGSANCFGHSCATRVARTEVTPISYPIPCTVASGFHLTQYAANNYSQMNDFTSTNVPLDNAQAYSTTSQIFCTAPYSLLESYSCHSNTPYMLPTISYYNGVLDLYKHESMDGQLDRTSSKDSPSSNVGIYLVLEKQRELIAGLVMEDAFVLHLNFMLSRQVIRPKEKMTGRLL